MMASPTDDKTLNAALRSLNLTRRQCEALKMILAGNSQSEIRKRLGDHVPANTNAILAEQLSPELHALLMQKYERANRCLIAERAARAKDWWPDYKALTAEIERLKRILRERCIRDPMSVKTS
jgi:hypothetical protein